MEDCHANNVLTHQSLISLVLKDRQLLTGRMEQERRPLEVLIIGGSLAGLMCGIALKHAGHNITIVEREDDHRQSHMAGVCLGLDAVRFLERHDRHSTPFSLRTTRIQAMKADGGVYILANGRREITSWDTYYFRLRSLFDGFISTYYPSAPTPSTTDGKVVYLSRTEVRELERNPDDDNGRVSVTIMDKDSQRLSTKQADLVIGADGPNSFIRAKYLPSIQRQYVGYIAWRGTVLESKLSPSTQEAFRRSVTVCMHGRQHCIVYAIPGPDGSLEPGERIFNFLWYTNETPQALDEIMLDGVDRQHRHHNIVPAGHVRKDIWVARLQEAEKIPLPPPFLEVISKIERPFIQKITEFCSTQAAFEHGKVLLVGDGLCLFRPHTAFSGTQAAFHALNLEDLVAGKITLREWEDRVTRYSRLHWIQSIWWGAFYQCGVPWAAVCAVRYWMLCGVEKTLAWWRGEEGLLRGSSSVVERYEDE